MVSTNDEVQQTASADVQIEQETSEIKSIRFGSIILILGAI